MMRVSSRFLPGLLGAPRWVRDVSWTADGATWAPLKFHDGDVTADATSQVRWSTRVTASGATPGRHGINPYGCLLRVRLGLAFSPLDIEWVPMGLYRLTKVRQQYRSERLELAGESLEAAVIEDEFLTPRIIPARSGESTVRALLQESIPGVSLAWNLGDDIAAAQIATDTSRWDVIDGKRESGSIARALGAIVYASRFGGFVADEVPTLQDDPVWTVEEGEGGVHIESGLELSRDDVFNVVAAAGQSESGTPVGPGIAEDDDPLSPTYTGRSPLAGGYGRVVYHYSSPLLRTLEQAQKAARSILAPLLGARQRLDFQAVFNPALEPGDVVLVRNPQGLSPTLLDRVSFDLSNLSMTAQCRSTQGPVAGTARVLPPTTQEG